MYKFEIRELNSTLSNTDNDFTFGVPPSRYSSLGLKAEIRPTDTNVRIVFSDYI